MFHRFVKLGGSKLGFLSDKQQRYAQSVGASWGELEGGTKSDLEWWGIEFESRKSARRDAFLKSLVAAREVGVPWGELAKLTGKSVQTLWRYFKEAKGKGFENVE